MSYLELDGNRHAIPAGESVIGSDPSSLLALGDPGIASRHLVVVATSDGQASVRRATDDAETYINGVLLGPQPAPLLHGDKIEVGGREFSFVDERRSGSTTFVSADDIARLQAVGAKPAAKRKATAGTGGRLVSLTDGREYAIEGGSLAIGREATCEVVVAHKRVSRRHAEITATPKGYVIIDMSSNGTFVNGERVSGQRLLARADVIRLGDHEFRFYADKAVEPEAPAPSPPTPAPPSAPPEPPPRAAPGAEYRLGDTLHGIPSTAPPFGVPAPSPAAPAAALPPAAPGPPAAAPPAPPVPEPVAPAATPPTPPAPETVAPVAPAAPAAVGPPGPPAAAPPVPAVPEPVAPAPVSPAAPAGAAPPAVPGPPAAAPPAPPAPEPVASPQVPPAPPAAAPSAPPPAAPIAPTASPGEAPPPTAAAPPPAPPGPSVAAGSSPGNLANLIVRSGALKGQRFPIRVPVVNLGRADYNDIVIADLSVSSSHAKIQLREGIWILVDLGSTNGSFVDGERVEDEAPLAPGALIRFGDLSVVFEPTKDDSAQMGGGTQVLGSIKIPPQREA